MALEARCLASTSEAIDLPAANAILERKSLTSPTHFRAGELTPPTSPFTPCPADPSVTAGEGTMATLKEQGFYMPGEWHPHKRCWMSWPGEIAGYGGRVAQARQTSARVAAAIARFEPVIMLANEGDVAHARRCAGHPSKCRPPPSMTAGSATTGRAS